MSVFSNIVQPQKLRCFDWLFSCRSACRRSFSGSWEQPETADVERAAQWGSWYWLRLRWLPSQWRCHPPQKLSGRAARAPADAAPPTRSLENHRFVWFLNTSFHPVHHSLLPSHFLIKLYLLFLAELTTFDDQGNKTSLPDKERQIEALQLLLLLLPTANRTLLKLLLDLLYHTAKQQDKNKMSAHNLALMFAPHVIWPKNVCDLFPFLIVKHSSIIFHVLHVAFFRWMPVTFRRTLRN